MIYLYVLAAAIFTIGFAAIFHGLMNTIINGDNEVDAKAIDRLQTKLFIRTAILEAVPILLLLFTFITLEPEPGMSIVLPAALILLFVAVSALRIFQSFRDAKGSLDGEELKKKITAMLFVALPLLGAIPLIAIVFLFIHAG
ncbi:hypothetical protein SAMN05421736_106150 [Evansella caseinilytica]|uniref:Uncharacterized protein n=1 Tax=Evansella caseinilytica TaxID=1503961 RepID=A0A1H3QGD5_9BACI|nr:hypothetical protein [Evansella caseinilytica]SDZ12075.1 hypothetical protein SAMN05421736_106150 [Evansella caseinilytica]